MFIDFCWKVLLDVGVMFENFNATVYLCLRTCIGVKTKLVFGVTILPRQPTLHSKTVGPNSTATLL